MLPHLDPIIVPRAYAVKASREVSGDIGRDRLPRDVLLDSRPSTATIPGTGTGGGAVRRPSLPLLTLICTWTLTTGAPVCARQTVGGSWIWHPGSSATATVNHPAGTWYFRRHVVIPNDRPIKTATCRITADNAFVLFVNGTKVGSGNNWQDI